MSSTQHTAWLGVSTQCKLANHLVILTTSLQGRQYESHFAAKGAEIKLLGEKRQCFRDALDGSCFLAFSESSSNSSSFLV